MSNINEIIINEMQPLINMFNSFEQALVDPNEPEQIDPTQIEQPEDQQMQTTDPSMAQQQPEMDQSMVNAQITQQQ